MAGAALDRDAVAPARERAPPRALAWAREIATFVAIGLTFTVSSMLLTHFGYHYESTGGSPLEKFHPGTLALLAAFALLVAQEGIDATLGRLRREHALAGLHLACVTYYIAYLALVLESPVTFVIDTLVAPALTVMLLARMDDTMLRRIATGIHLVMATNAALGAIESLLQWRLIPFYLDDEIVTYDWRSTALLGHPLQNAAITAVYALLLIIGPRGGLPRGLTLPALMLQLVALPAFGGRTAFVALACAGGLWLMGQGMQMLAGRRFPLAGLLWLAGALPVVAAALWLALDSSYVGLFIDRFVDDSGSAETRVRMFTLLREFTWGELLVGPDPRTLAALQVREDLTLGIESFVVAYVLRSGLFATAVLFLGLTAFLVALARTLPWQGTAALLLFFGLNLVSTGISSKTTSLTLVVVMLTAFARSASVFRPAAGRHESRHHPATLTVHERSSGS